MTGRPAAPLGKGSPEAIRAAQRREFDGITHAAASTIGQVLDELERTGTVSKRLRDRLVAARAALRRTCAECVADDNRAAAKAAKKESRPVTGA